MNDLVETAVRTQFRLAAQLRVDQSLVLACGNAQTKPVSGRSLQSYDFVRVELFY